MYVGGDNANKESAHGTLTQKEITKSKSTHHSYYGEPWPVMTQNIAALNEPLNSEASDIHSKIFRETIIFSFYAKNSSDWKLRQRGNVCLNLLPAGDQQPEDELNSPLDPEDIFRYIYEEQIPPGTVNKGPSRSFADDLYVLLHLNILSP